MSADLIAKIRTTPGSQRVWTAWYKSAYTKVYYAAYRFSYGNRDTARDLTQETFKRFIEYRAIDRVKDDKHALAFLIRTCRNLAIDRNVSVAEISLEGLPEAEFPAAPEANTQHAFALDQILPTLNAEDREIIEYLRNGLTVAEIAQKLKISYSAAGVRLHRMRKRLRESLV